MNFSPFSPHNTHRRWLCSQYRHLPVLWVQIRHVLHNLSAIKQTVEEANEQILVHCCSKNSLETEIGQQADVSFFYLFHTLYHIIIICFRDIRLSLSLLQKFKTFIRNKQENWENFYFINTRIFGKSLYFQRKVNIFAKTFWMAKCS